MIEIRIAPEMRKSASQGLSFFIENKECWDSIRGASLSP